MLNETQMDACAGIALLYMGPSGEGNEHTGRLQVCMEGGHVGGAEHETAVMLCKLIPQLERELLEFIAERWLAAFSAPAPAPEPAHEKPVVGLFTRT